MIYRHWKRWAHRTICPGCRFKRTIDANSIVVIAGIAEIAAGSIAMGLGGYLAGKTEQDHYNSELKENIMKWITFGSVK